MTDSKLLDSSVWIDFFIKDKFYEVINSEENIFSSVLSLYEIKRKLIKDKIKMEEINKVLEFIKKRSIILPTDEKISEEAANLSLKHNLSAIDSLIYATSIINETRLITLDNDFRGLENIEILNM